MMCFRHTLRGLVLAGLMTATCAAVASGNAIAQTAGPISSTLVPADFPVPTSATDTGFRIVPLSPALAKIDYDAYMSSIEHLQKTFSRSASWPHDGITDADTIADMENEQSRFQARKSFAYAVLTPDGKRERGCVYVRPSPVPGYDAQVVLWVTQAEYDAGFDAELYAFVQDWMASDWPFAKVAYPGRAIDWATWDATVEAAKIKG